MVINQMCRVCLAEDVRMHCVLNSPLQEMYEKITNIPMSSENKTAIVCYICRSFLKKCYLFHNTAERSDVLLTKILNGEESEKITPSYTLNHLNITPTVIIDTIDTQVNGNEGVIDEVIKKELDEELDDVKADQLGDKVEQESDHHSHSPRHTDSEDDVPLETFRSSKNMKKGKKKVKKYEKVFTADYATEIVLTKEEQIQELRERATTLNYLNSPLKCDMCFKGYVDPRAYDNHMSKHDEKSGPFECDICHMRYSTDRRLKTHGLSTHQRRFACVRCPHKSHTTSQAREHEKWHSGFRYECKLCGLKFNKSTSFLSHQRKRHPSQHVCDICGDSFVGRHGLLMHKTKVHLGDKPQESTEPASERFCSECNTQFATIDAWRTHILTSFKHKAANESSLICRICKLQCLSLSEMSVHLKQHRKLLRDARGGRLVGKIVAHVTCEQCGAKFINRGKLLAHIRKIHLGIKKNKNIVCEVCGTKFTSNASLKYHQRTHTGEKPYPCPVCNKRFVDRNQLRIHNRTHTGEKPYCCTTCGQRFSQKPALNRHFRIHTGAKPYTCHLCPKSFSQSNSLKLHVSTVHLKQPKKRKQIDQDIVAKVEDNIHNL